MSAMMHDLWRLTNELFVIPDGDHYILYAPLKGAVSTLNRSGVEQLAQIGRDGGTSSVPDALEPLAAVGILEPASEPPQAIPAPRDCAGPFRPTGVILLTTSFCNFRCVYCYASAGATTRRIDSQIAEAAIRMVVQNAIDLGAPVSEIAFHGGGEPTTAFSFVKHCVEYARSVAQGRVKIAPSIVTNGYLGDRQIEWLIRNMDSIQVSLDGPSEVQNVQRPLADGGPTFDQVAGTVHKLLAGGVRQLLIKATIPKPTVPRLPEIAAFLCETFPLERFHFGPVLEFGRSRQTGYIEPEVKEFVHYALQAQAVAAFYGKRVVVCGAQETFPNLRHEFCGLTEPNFAITVDGQVSGCYEILEGSDLRAGIFHYGAFREGEFSFDLDKIAQLRRRQHVLAPKCHNCFARWQCTGDCQIRWYDEVTAEFSDQADFRCELNRAMIKHELQNWLAQPDKVARHVPVIDSRPHAAII